MNNIKFNITYPDITVIDMVQVTKTCEIGHPTKNDTPISIPLKRILNVCMRKGVRVIEVDNKFIPVDSDYVICDYVISLPYGISVYGPFDGCIDKWVTVSDTGAKESVCNISNKGVVPLEIGTALLQRSFTTSVTVGTAFLREPDFNKRFMTKLCKFAKFIKPHYWI